MNINASAIDSFYRRHDTFAVRLAAQSEKRSTFAPVAAAARSSSVWLDVFLTKVVFTLSIHPARIHLRDCETALSEEMEGAERTRDKPLENARYSFGEISL